MFALRMRALGLAIAALLITAAPAAADNTYLVSTPAADATGSCPPAGSGLFNCSTLRAAVTAANGSTGHDVISIGAGAYPLTLGALTLSQDTSIAGAGARFTTIQVSGSQGFIINSGVSADFALTTIQGGNAASGSGGNISNSGTLTLTYMRLTGGAALNGGGLANIGASGATAQIAFSLIDHNSGAGVANIGQTFPANLTMYASTIALNTSGGGLSKTNGGTVTISESTIARNTGTGLAINASTSVTGSIVANNTTNCSAAVTTNGGGNLENTATCGFGAAGSSKDPLLDTALTNQGGQTDVLTIPANSPAIGIVQPCTFPVDQRGGQRVLNPSDACDAGAYEQAVAVAPPPPPPEPTPTPTPTPVPVPVPQKDATGTPSGTVKIKLPGGKFVAFDPGQAIPNGAEIDVTKGRIELTAKLTAGGKPQTATFYDGIFKLKLGKKTTDLTLSQPLAKCPKKHSAHAAAKKKPKSRKLWGKGSGSFRTRGQYSAATVRGTQWLVQDSCSGTLTRVKTGVVSVRDEVRRKTIILRAPHSYLAKPRR